MSFKGLSVNDWFGITLDELLFFGYPNPGKMKNLIFLLILSGVFLVGCNKPTGQNSKSLIDSLKKAIRDSIVQAQNTRKNPGNLPIQWQIGKFKDEFGDETKERFLGTFVEGRFSNSATSNSPLFVQILMTKDNGAVFLHEYKPSNPSQGFSSVQLQMKNAAGEKELLRCYGKWAQSGGIKIEDGELSYQRDYSKFKEFVRRSNGEVKIVISDEYSSVYNFTIDTKGFMDEFGKL